MEGWRRADGLVHWGCVEKRRTRQQAYMQRRRDDFFFRAEEDLRLRRYRALQRRAARDAERAALYRDDETERRSDRIRNDITRELDFAHV